MTNTMSSLANQIIPYSKLKATLPEREKFLNPQQVKLIDQTIEDKKPLLFLPTYLYEAHIQDVKYEKAIYKIIMMGILPDGRRVNVVLDNIEPYFEVRIPHPTDPTDQQLRGANYNRAQYINELREKISRDEITKPEKTTIIKAKPFKYYRPEQSEFIRFYYKKTKNRQTAINFVKKEGYETATDDLNSYYRVVCRDYLTTFSSWAVLENYYESTVESIKGNTFRVDIKNYKAYTGVLTPELLKDKTLSVCWDIETWSKSGNLPMAENKEDRIFSLSMTFQWVNETEPFLKICLCDLPANPKPGYLTIVCGSEKNILKGFADIFAKMKPEFIFGFNDSDYDWNWVIGRAEQTKGMLCYMAERFDSTVPFQSYTDANVKKFNFKTEHVKVEATSYADGSSLMMHGYIPVDVRTVFRKLYPTAEQSSLKFFLAKNKLGGKEDMPIAQLFKIYTDLKAIADSEYVKFAADGTMIDFEFIKDTPQHILNDYERLKNEMADVNYYCVVDSQRCHDLVKIRSVIMDHREVSNLAYTSVYDAFYRANGMKVRNLTIAKGQKAPFNIRFTNIGDYRGKSDDKYPGAFVFPPKKGLKITKLSIEERIRKAKETKDAQHPDCQEWLLDDLNSDEVKQMYNIVETYGAVQKRESITAIEEKTGIKLPKRFKEFLTEVIGRPIAGLDFSSLYPSLIRCYNFTPEYCILNKARAKEIAETGQKITKVDFEFGGRRRVGYFVWHNNELSPTKEVVEMINNVEVKRTIPNEKFQFGVYPYILDELFNKRSMLKKDMKKFAHQKEEMEAKGDTSSSEYVNVCFNLNYLNSKQNALKVFMNTFYGEAGNQISPFFVLEVAGGITQYGKENIQLGFRTVVGKGCQVVYGDTDSLYISMPEETFTELDKIFYTGKMSKLDYWTKLVEMSFITIDAIRDHVNNTFFLDNGTKFLSMAYEEFLYPVAFTAKKKYFGIAHENIANFKPKDLFVRGLEVKKRGVSDLLKKIFTEIMWTCMDPNNLLTVRELVQNKINEIYTRKWDPKDFIQTDVYRPNKNNVKVKRFVERMKERGIAVKPNERFEYVIVKKYPYNYDYRGRKETLGVGDKVERVDIAANENLEIDLDHYMQSSINGQLGRLITYHKDFHVEPIDNTDDELKVAEVKIYKNACKFVDEYCKKYYASYNTFGKTYQKMFKTANKIIGGRVQEKDPLVSELLTANVDLSDIGTWLENQAEKESVKICGDYGKTYVLGELAKLETREQKAEKLLLLQKIYHGSQKNNISNTREKAFSETMNVLRRKVRESLNEITTLYSTYHAGVRTLMDTIKAELSITESLFKSTDKEQAREYKLEDFTEDIDEAELDVKAQEYTERMFNDVQVQVIMDKFKNLYNDLVAAYVTIKRTRSVVDYLKMRRDHQVRVVVRPDDEVMRNVIADGVNEALADDLVL